MPELEALLLDGLDSGMPIEVDDIDAYFAGKNKAMVQRAEASSTAAR